MLYTVNRDDSRAHTYIIDGNLSNMYIAYILITLASLMLVFVRIISLATNETEDQPRFAFTAHLQC